LDDDDTMVDERRVVVGVCAMAKKSNSRPMQEILERLALFKDIRTFVFEESIILHVIVVFLSFYCRALIQHCISRKHSMFLLA